ncbi:IclR family transcriptional regulator [Prauserella cavernicola]|nr:IclR family transcriptional regulator [Prauserella cavernicola]
MRIIFAVAHSGQRDVGVTELARSLGLGKAVVHRVVRTLTESGFFEYDPATRRYRLGPGALSIGLAATARLDVADPARPYLEEMVADTGETAALSMRCGDQRMYVSQVLSPSEFRMSVPIGGMFPLHVGASSKAILAALPDAEIEAYYDRQFDGFVTIMSKAGLLAEMRRTRRRGYLATKGERQLDAGSVAAPVFDGTGRVFGCMSICIPLARMRDDLIERYGQLVGHATRELSTRLGHHA